MLRSLPIALLVVMALSVLPAAAQQGGGTGGTGGGAGGTGGAATGGSQGELPTLDLSGQFSENNTSSAFTDNRRTAAQTGGQAGGGQRGGFTMSGGPGGLLGQLFGGQFSAPTSSRRLLRAPMKVEFDVVRPESTQVADVLSNRFANIAPLRQVGSSISVDVDNRVATLRGTVDTQRQKEMAERMTRLEPGVSSVVNLITVREE
ncbi:MAG TPA: BON domain-containing protein [Pirellulaceae bacterium]|nr:BON domain-containing protein [Pirellulaceae bacterium]